MNTIERTPPEVIRTLIDKEGRIAVAFSGGADSLALLVGVCEVRDPEDIVALYVNHRLRPEEELEAELVLNRKNAERLGVVFEVLDLGPGSVEDLAKERKKGVEEAARTLRYQVLLRACKMHGCSTLLTGHNADDQLETLLRRLFTAGSLSSLQGIRSRLEQDGITILRPVLNCPHKDLEAYLVEGGWAWSEDSTNKAETYQRNLLRRRMTGDLLSIFEGAYTALEVQTGRFADLAVFLESSVEKAFEGVDVRGDEASFSLSWFQLLPSTVQELLLFRLAGADSSSAFIANVHRALKADKHAIMESGSHRIEVHRGVVTWKRNEEPWSYAIEAIGDEIVLPGNLVFRRETENRDSTLLRIDGTVLENPVLRLSRDGDEFAGEGGTANVAKILSSQGLPPALRVPVLVDRSGIVAIFARVYGGRDRLAKRFKAPLARRLTNIYSVSRRIDDEIYE
ncbi:MAG TPA: tRNA lysidine(34) synthetase TilS [Sphaerochaeta sp.]|nr:tRNA lysidine(34) synthetase TilS [Sphaerochaeta sp.]